MIQIRLRMRTFLRSIDEASLRRICETAMLTQEETDILIRTLSRRQDTYFVSDLHNISLSTLQRKMTQAVLKIRFRLGIRHFFTDEEIRQRVENALTTTEKVRITE